MAADRAAGERDRTAAAVPVRVGGGDPGGGGGVPAAGRRCGAEGGGRGDGGRAERVHQAGDGGRRGAGPGAAARVGLSFRRVSFFEGRGGGVGDARGGFGGATEQAAVHVRGRCVTSPPARGRTQVRSARAAVLRVSLCSAGVSFFEPLLAT